MADLQEFPAMNQVYQEFISDDGIKPARTTFQAGKLPIGARYKLIINY